MTEGRAKTASKGAVPVTGAASGIGLAVATHLAELGFRVFAGVRQPDADPVLQPAARLTPVRLDVADGAAIRAPLR